MSKDHYDDDVGYMSDKSFGFYFWEWFYPYLNRHKYIIAGLVSIIIAYYCSAPAFDCFNRVAGKSISELDALEGLYFIGSALAGSAVLFGSIMAVKQGISLWKNQVEDVDLNNAESDECDHDHSPNNNKSTRHCVDNGMLNSDYNYTSTKSSPRIITAIPVQGSQDTCQHPAQPCSQSPRTLSPGDR